MDFLDDATSIDELLARLLSDHVDIEERAEAAWALAEQGRTDDRIVPALIGALEYRGPKSLSLSDAAHTASLFFSNDEVTLVGRLRSRWRWRGTLRRIAQDFPKRMAGVFSVDPFTRTPESVALAQYYSDCVKSISDRAAALALADEIDASISDDWANLESFRLRAAAAAALGKIRDARAVNALIALLDDEDDVVRHSAAEALGEIGDKRAIGPLKRAVHLQRFDFYSPPSFGKFAHLFPKKSRSEW